MNQIRTTQVMIVGGGPVGLTVALLLEGLGIDCVLVERNERTSTHPKARGIYPRGMELMRKLGVEQAIRDRALPGAADSMVICESLRGPEYARTSPERQSGQLTPAWKCMVSQDVVEEALFARAVSGQHAQIRFGEACLEVAQQADSVRVVTRRAQGQQVTEWRAQFVVAAEGASGQIRAQLGITDLTASRQGMWVSEFWRGDLSRFPVIHESWAFQMIPRSSAEPTTLLLNTNATGRWLTSMRLPDGGHDRPWTDAELTGVIRRQIGDPDLQVELLGTAVWRMADRIASSFSRGRVFLAGDAAHVISPVGGFGLNTGLDDAHNLAWKLAFVLRGYAPDSLLATYEQERQPVAIANAQWSAAGTQGLQLRGAIEGGDPEWLSFWVSEVERNYHTAGRSLGYRYEAGAVIPDGTRPGPFDDAVYTPTDRPGSRCPHLWLDAARRRSTLDWFTSDLTVVAGPGGQAWAAAARAAAATGVRLRVEFLPGDGYQSGYRIGERGALLVRPDGHVAWRRPGGPSPDGRELTEAVQAVLTGAASRRDPAAAVSGGGRVTAAD